MGFGLITLALLLMTSSPACRADVEPMVWEINWDNFDMVDFENLEPFSSPGVIAGSHTFDNTMEVIGKAWEASPTQEMIGLLCVNYGPLIYALYDDETSKKEFKKTCNHIVDSLKWGVRSDVMESCGVVLEQLEFGINENNTFFTLEECYTSKADEDAVDNKTSFAYAGEVIAGVYSSCQDGDGYGLGTDRLSALAFGVLDWLGPPVLYAVSEDTLTPLFGGCSLLRYVLTLELTEITDAIKTLMSFPIADTLEYLQYLQICSKLDENVDHSQGFSLIFDLLLSFSKRTSASMCTFFSAKNTRDDYIEEAAKIADGMQSVTTNATLCQELLAEIANSTDAIDILMAVTGEDLSSATGRNSLCSNLEDAFSSPVELEEYSLPAGVDINENEFLSEEGELLPGFTFDDALKFAGAIYSSKNVIAAAVTCCTVFENFVVDNEVFSGVDVAKLCGFFRDDRLEQIETFCLERTVLAQDNTYPLSLRKIDPLMIGGDMARRLIGMKNYSRGDICRTINDFVNSDYNLRSIVSFAITTFVKEGLPLANGVCQDWSDVICYLGPYCGSSVDDELTKQAYYMDQVITIEDFILLSLGYPTRTALCNKIESGINRLSGRAKDEVVEDLRSQILFILDNHGRCTEVANAAKELAWSEMPTLNEGEIEYYMYMVTGRNTTSDICEEITSTFPSYGLPTTQISLLVTVISFLLAMFTKN